MLPSPVEEATLSAVHDALYRNRRLAVCYHRRSEEEQKNSEINPRSGLSGWRHLPGLHVLGVSGLQTPPPAPNIGSNRAGQGVDRTGRVQSGETLPLFSTQSSKNVRR
jgi:hypothetical protein